MNPDSTPVLFGESFAAVLAAHLLERQNRPFRWIAGSRSRLLPVLPCSLSQETLVQMRGLKPAGVGYKEAELGVWFYKNRKWKKIPKAAAQQYFDHEFLRAQFELALSIQPLCSMMEWEESLRTQVKAIPETGIGLETLSRQSVALTNGETIAASQIVFADRAQAMRPYPSKLRGKDYMTALQVVFQAPDGQVLIDQVRALQTHLLPLNEDSADIAFGYFDQAGARALFTVWLDPEEAEDNQKVTRQYRRLKSAMERAFPESPLASDTVQFTLRLEPSICLIKAIEIPAIPEKVQGVLCSDSFGLDSSLTAVLGWASQEGLLEGLDSQDQPTDEETAILAHSDISDAGETDAPDASPEDEARIEESLTRRPEIVDEQDALVATEETSES